jgi:hypothetical protein
VRPMTNLSSPSLRLSEVGELEKILRYTEMSKRKATTFDPKQG